MNLKHVYSVAEAAHIWEMHESNLRNALNTYNRFSKQIQEGTAKRSKFTWIVSKQAMEEVFGKMKMYKNVDTGYVLSAQELYELHIREYKDMWKYQSEEAENFKSEDAFIKYMLENDLDNDFVEVETDEQ